LSRHLAGAKLTEIDVDRIDGLINLRKAEPAGGNNRDLLPARQLSDTTINRYMSALSTVMNCAVKWGWITAFPKIRKLTEPNVRVMYLTPEEANALITELPMHLAEMAAFSLATGLRENNVLELEWRNIDMKRHVAWIHGDQTKNDKPLSVPLDANAMAVLKQRAAAAENAQYVFTYRKKPVHKASTAAWYKAMRRVEEILGTELPKGFKWHGLRHTWASWHVMSGTPIEVLKELGGWADLRMVIRYAHLHPGHVEKYAKSMKPMGRI
jgi:integrase